MVVIIPFLPAPSTPTAGFAVFLGRFHPLLLHFPIVLVLLTVGVEAWIYFRSRRMSNDEPGQARVVIDILLFSSLASGLITVIGGYLLYRSGEYQGELVRLHLWGGVLLMLALIGAALFRWSPAPIKRSHVYQVFLLSAGGLIIFTSHMGGSITHGQNFLTEHMPNFGSTEPAPVEMKEPKDLLLFQDLILPILDSRCLGCHNQYKTKGGLLMTTYSDLMKGGKSEKPMLVANDPGQSEFGKRGRSF